MAPATDTYARVRAACSGDGTIDMDKHAASITEVVALVRQRGIREFTSRDQAPKRP